jgi:hypothetical protein
MKKPLRNRLDNIIRERLERLYPPYSPSHWDKLEEQLNEGILDEEVPASTPGTSFQELDAALFEKMHAYQAADKSADHWALMEQRLQQALSWPQYVLRYKSAELALILLLFAGLWHWLPAHQPTKVQAFDIPMKGAEVSTTEDTYPISNTTETKHKDQGQAYHSGLAQVGETAVSNSNVASTLSPSFSKNDAGSPRSEQTGRSNLALAAPVLPTPALPSSLSSLHEAKDEESFDIKPIPTDRLGLEDLNPIAQREAGLLDYPATSLDELLTAADKRATKIRLGMFANGEYNHILVPASEDRGLSESFERAAFGYGSGLSLDFDFGRVEIGTGLIYAARRYPVGLVYLEGSVSQGFEGEELHTTELNIINMPLHFRYDFIQQGKWRGYVLAGGAVQVAFQTHYFTASAPDQFNFQPAMPVPISDGGGDTEKAIDRIKQDGVGWFEGGSFEDNAYLTANLGFGVERFISERWSLFAQPVYQYSLHYFKKIDGLGPNEDRINSLSVLFGTRVRLK